MSRSVRAPISTNLHDGPKNVSDHLPSARSHLPDVTRRSRASLRRYPRSVSPPVETNWAGFHSELRGKIAHTTSSLEKMHARNTKRLVEVHGLAPTAPAPTAEEQRWLDWQMMKNLRRFEDQAMDEIVQEMMADPETDQQEWLEREMHDADMLDQLKGMECAMPPSPHR